MKKRNNKLIQDINHEQLKKQDKYSWLLIPMIMLICYSTMIFIRLTTNKVDSLYIKSNYGLFFISFAFIFYHVLLSFFKINLFKDYLEFISSLKTINFNEKSFQDTFINLINLLMSLIILIFIIDWSFWGGYMFKVGTILSIFFIFTIIEIVKATIKSKSKN